MKLIFVRHGESIGNVKYGFISGRTDPAGLTHKGRSQIIRSAWELRDEKIHRIVASPVARAQETAGIFRHYFKSAEFETQEWLTELYHGIFEGFRWWEVIHKVPPEWRKEREQFQTAFPGGESMETLAVRVWDGFSQFCEKVDPHETVLLVSHQAVISAVRYIATHGDPSTLRTKQAQSGFVQFMKNVQLQNGGYVVLSRGSDATFQTHEVNSFTPVKPRHNNVAWYAQGILRSSQSLEAKRMETASGNAVYSIELPDDEMKLVKIIKGNDSHVVKRQRDLYAYLRANGINTPVIEHYDTSHAFFEIDAFIQDYVKGETVKECFDASTGQCSTLLNDLYSVLNRIHLLPLSEVENFWIPPVDEPFLEWKTFMQYNINLTLHMLQLSEIGTKNKEYIYKELSQLASYLLSDEYTLCPIHGDPGTGNFIIYQEKKGCKLMRIIDFEWARIGDPLWDFAYLWGWLERNYSEAAHAWEALLRKKRKNDFVQLNRYRILFHAWTVRDMLDYKSDTIRLSRGKKSLALLQKLSDSGMRL